VYSRPQTGIGVLRYVRGSADIHICEFSAARKPLAHWFWHGVRLI
jgi:hypothetical protein